MLKLAIKNLFVAILFLYPLLVYLSVRYFSVTTASLVLSLILAGRLILLRSTKADLEKNSFGQTFDAILWIVLLNNLSNLYFKSEIALKIYPVLMSLGISTIFVHSLWVKRPIIEKFARLYEKSLSEARLKYIWNLTLVWSLWLSCNTLLALYTAAFSSFDNWMLYNNVIFYLICGILFLVDISYRKLILDKREKNEARVYLK